MKTPRRLSGKQIIGAVMGVKLSAIRNCYDGGAVGGNWINTVGGLDFAITEVGAPPLHPSYGGRAWRRHPDQTIAASARYVLWVADHVSA